MKHQLNQGIEGRILDEESNPIEGLIVTAEGVLGIERGIMDNPWSNLQRNIRPLKLKKIMS